MQPLPDAGLLPGPQPPPRDHPTAEPELLRQMLPADPGVQDEQDPLQRQAVIERLTTRMAEAPRLARQQRLDPLPQPVRHLPRPRPHRHPPEIDDKCRRTSLPRARSLHSVRASKVSAHFRKHCASARRGHASLAPVSEVEVAEACRVRARARARPRGNVPARSEVAERARRVARARPVRRLRGLLQLDAEAPACSAPSSRTQAARRRGPGTGRSIASSSVSRGDALRVEQLAGDRDRVESGAVDAGGRAAPASSKPHTPPNICATAPPPARPRDPRTQVEAAVGVHAPRPRAARSPMSPSNARPMRSLSRWRTVEPGGPASSPRSTMPSSTATRTATAVASFVTHVHAGTPSWIAVHGLDLAGHGNGNVVRTATLPLAAQPLHRPRLSR